MHRARFILFLLVGLCVFLSLPLINLLPRIVRGDSLAIALAAQPLRSLWSVDGLEGRLAYVLVRCCDVSTTPNRVVVGKDGFLFLGNKFDRVIDKTIGTYRPALSEIDVGARAVARLREFVESQNAAFAMIIAPNKHSIYPEFLPANLVPAENNMTDDFLASAAEIGLPILDLRPSLRDHKADGPLYYRTDTHWTHVGAAIAHNKTMAFLANQTGQTFAPPIFTQHSARSDPGDLAALLKITLSLGDAYERDSSYDFGNTVICQGQIALANGAHTPCTPAVFHDISVNPSAIIVTRVPDAPNAQSVLILCDSFCGGTSTLLNASFQTVYRAPWANLTGAALREHIARLAPDIVMVQVVERLLLSRQIGLE